MGNIANNLMIADLTTGWWKATKTDKKLRKEVADWKNTSEEMLRVGKNLFPRKQIPEAYSAVTSAFGRARDAHNEMTAPWNGDGGRVLKSSFHFDYNNKMREHRRECQHAWDSFKIVYPELKEWSRGLMPRIFNEADWPDERKLEKSFKFKLEFFPFPDSAAWILEVSELEMQSLREQAEESVKERLEMAMREPYRRLFAAVKAMVDRLNSDSEDIHTSVVENIRKACAIVPALNLTNDAYLEDLAVEIEAGLTAFSSEQLSVKGSLRNTVAARAQRLAGDLEGLVGVAA